MYGFGWCVVVCEYVVDVGYCDGVFVDCECFGYVVDGCYVEYVVVCVGLSIGCGCVVVVC